MKAAQIVESRDEVLFAEFLVWYFDPDKAGNQEQWARAHAMAPSTLSRWKEYPEFIAEQEKWRERLDKHFGSVMYAAYKRATDTDNFNALQIQAARFISDMLGKTPPKKLDMRVDVFTWLQSLSAEEEPAEGVFNELANGTGV